MPQHTDIKAACSRCGREQKTSRTKKNGALRVPKGWRRFGDELLCGGRKDRAGCVQQAYYVRAFRVEIRGLAEGEARDMREFRAALAAAAREQARCGNLYIQRKFAAELAVSENLKVVNGKHKLPPAPAIDRTAFYREAVARFPALSGGCVSGLMQMLDGWYNSDRFKAFVALNQSVRNYAFGYLPIEVRRQDWSLKSLSIDGKKCYSIHMSINPGKRWKTRIYADVENLARLKQVESGAAVPLGLKIVRANKRRIEGAPPRKAWFFRIAAMFPRKPPRRSHQEIRLTLGHDAGCLLFGALEGSDDVFEFPGVALHKIIVGGDRGDRAHQVELSLARGLWPKRKILRWGLDRSRFAENRARKIGAQLKLAAAALARWCKSHGVTSVDYDIQDRGFLPHCPWRALRDDINFALEREAIALHVLETDEPTEHEESGALAARESETGGTVDQAVTSP